ncbi:MULTISPECIES: helicase associated domain-containing protein [unclassified Streptomyces]|uniref:helicase associated domain-containing protein n=1 Tax=unclassified Streptomyces TaxID=2593676 RepID=UPI003809FF21
MVGRETEGGWSGVAGGIASDGNAPGFGDELVAGLESLIQAAQRYAQEHQDLRVPFGYRTPADWSPTDFPLGVWVTDCRRHYNVGRLDTDRVAQPQTLGMVWSHSDASFEEGLAAPVDSVVGEYPVSRWLKNQRAAARRAAELERCCIEGLPEPEGGTALLTDERRQALDDIDPGWSPAWSAGWQRAFQLAWPHIKAGGALPDKTGVAIADGEDLGKWAAAQRTGLAGLTRLSSGCSPACWTSPPSRPSAPGPVPPAGLASGTGSWADLSGVATTEHVPTARP